MPPVADTVTQRAHVAVEGVVPAETSGTQLWKKVPVGGMPSGSWHGPQGTHRLPDGEAATWILDSGVLASGVAGLGAADVHGYIRLATGRVVRSREAIDVVKLAELD